MSKFSLEEEEPQVASESYSKVLSSIRQKKGFIIDMDGVIYHGNKLLPGVKEFVTWLQHSGKKYLFLTNNSAPTPRELQQKLLRLGLDVNEEYFYTSGMSTARFLQSQKPEGGSVYCIGESGMAYALYEAGFIMNDVNPDYVILSESTSYNYEKISKAVRLVSQGAKLIATNLDVNGPDSSEDGGSVLTPACGSFVASVELATGKRAFYCGKPSSLIMRYAQRVLGLTRDETCIIGDRMDTDIVAGINAEIDPVLVLSGVTTLQMLDDFAYKPCIVLSNVGEIPPKENTSTPNLVG